MTGIIMENEGLFLPDVLKIKQLPVPEQEKELHNYICWVEDRLLDEPQITTGLNHTLIDGLYTRTMFVPKGTMLTGARHKKACLTMFISGEISILTVKGCARLKAPLVFPSAAGIRRLGYCHTDVLFATVHSVTSTNLDDIENELFDFDTPEI